LPDDNGEQTLNARLVVGCDGTASSVRQAVGIGTLEQDYLQTLFVARARAERGPMAPPGSALPTAARPRCCRGATATTG
jgi:2-polyprenyl-6-methoxyphenol hydroxylase and related FAD-dependent oxidoreductases